MNRPAASKMRNTGRLDSNGRKSFIARTPALVPALLIALVLSGCGSKYTASTGDPAVLPTAPVRMEAVQNRPWPVVEDVAASVRAKRRATIEARVSGIIDRLSVTLGQRVKAGDLIAHLNASEISARVQQAKASLDQAERDWKRLSGLFEQQAVSRSEYDAAEAREREAAAAAAEANAMLAYVDVIAPFDGVVTRKWADVGDLAAPGKPLVALEDPAVLQLEADVPEAIASHVQLGAGLTCRLDNLNGDVKGVVTEISAAADPASRTVRVLMDLPGQAGAKSGQFARLAVPLGESTTPRVAVSAVVQRGQLEIVFVVVNRHAQLRLVKTGRRTGGDVEILSGLEAGEMAVTDGAAQLTDGQPVEAK